MAVENLEGVRAELYKIFNEAIERHSDYEDSNSSGSSTPFNPTIHNRIAISTIARDIAAVEREQRKARELKPFPLNGKR